jgi:peptide-methionine (R)-S-oxide reductase
MSENKDDLKNKLTPEEYYVTQNHGTEPAFSGEFDKNYTPGTYHCVVCGTEIFSSEEKYDSGSGWPSFWKPSIDDHVETQEDRSAGMIRTEVHCSNCKAHLGHVFPDGPKPTGLRYCINSVSMSFKSSEEE